jgi:hypothetical protein
MFGGLHGASPFAAVTFVAAPALLTNASSVLIMSTINRMLRTRDAMHELMARSQTVATTPEEANLLIRQVNRVERQATMLMRALHAIYLALGAFAGATLVTLLGAGVAPLVGAWMLHTCAALGLALGAVGVGGLIFGCANLFHATHLSLANIREEAAVVRARQSPRAGAPEVITSEASKR